MPELTPDQINRATDLLPKEDIQSTLGNDTRSWTTYGNPAEGTYTLQAIVDADKERKNRDQVEDNKTSIDSLEDGGIKKVFKTTDEPGEAVSQEENTEPDRKNLKKIQEGFKATEPQEKPTLNFGWFIVTLLIALVLDTLDILVNLIPIIGQIASLILTMIGMFCIWMMHVFGGGKFDASAKKRLVYTAVVELIPIINMIPALTLCVLLSKYQPLAEKLIGGTVKKFWG